MKKDLKLYDVSFGILIFTPLGWLIMIAAIVIEMIIMSKMLSRKIFNRFVAFAPFISNIISGIIGVIISLKLNGGWWLVFWFPWVSSNEVTKKAMPIFVVYFVLAFILSVVIELLINLLLLKSKYEKKQILISTLIANICSYIMIVSFVYAMGFGLINTSVFLHLFY